ncbi:MFS transporter, partial [Pseudomonas fragi]|nr:MFS transporter [Pseudomonas sp. GC01]
RSVFVFGGLVTFAVIPLVLLWLPESLDFLLARRPATALQRINRLARRLGQPPLSQMPPLVASPSGNRNALGALLAPAMRRTTLVIWLLFFLVMFGFYFVMSWTPKLLVSAGLSAQQGITGGVLLSVGGI